MDHICTAKDNGTKALDLYKNLWGQVDSMKECPRPCKFTKVYVRSDTIRKKGRFIFKFNWFITTTKSRYAYNGLEFLAEFGGYVGLFLGISIFDLRVAFRTIVRIVMRREKYFSK